MYQRNTGQFYNSGRDTPDASEIREAAGINPRALPAFVDEVSRAVRKGAKETKNFSQLASYLNDRNILNARGRPWTHATIQAFIKHYTNPARPESN
jgi:hypothetical protein